MQQKQLLLSAQKNSALRLAVNIQNIPYFLSHESLLPDRNPAPVKSTSLHNILRYRQNGWLFGKEENSRNFSIQHKASSILQGEIILADGAVTGITFALLPGDELLGLGATPGGALRNHSSVNLINIDTLFYSIPESVYASFPGVMLKRGKDLFYFFLPSSYPSRFESNGSAFSFTCLTDEPVSLDLILLQESGEGSFGRILEIYTSLTGRPYLPPVWSLGFHQSRYSYKSEAEVYSIADRMRRENIPCDSIWLDIDYMDAFKVFTWNRHNFPDPETMNATLERNGFRTVAIVDPGIKVDSSWPVYQDGLERDVFLKTRQGNLFVGKVWPGKTIFPDFSREDVREWWAHLHSELLQNGVSGIWNDMNDPVLWLDKKYNPLAENIKHEFGSHARYRNLYAIQMARSTLDALEKIQPEKRAFVLTRSGSPGIQRYSFLWTGDNITSWKHLSENLHHVLHLGINGVPFTGADVGGFGSRNPFMRMVKLIRDRELFIRWNELGSLMPFYRIHTVKNSYSQDPWSLGKEALRLTRMQIFRRYTLLPYYYWLARESTLTGIPVIRPVFSLFPELSHSEHQDKFLIGNSILVAPILQKGQKEKTLRLPPGNWYSYSTLQLMASNTEITEPSPLGRYPMFVKSGSILPKAIPGRNAPETLQGSLVLEIYPDAKMYGEYYLDDGSSKSYLQNKFFLLIMDGSMDKSGKIHLNISVKNKKYNPAYAFISVRLPKEYTIAKSGRKDFRRETVSLAEEGRDTIVSEFLLPTSIRSVFFAKK